MRVCPQLLLVSPAMNLTPGVVGKLKRKRRGPHPSRTSSRAKPKGADCVLALFLVRIEYGKRITRASTPRSGYECVTRRAILKLLACRTRLVTQHVDCLQNRPFKALGFCENV